MATDLKLPDLGDSVASAVVVGILVKEGDLLEVGAPFLELETDKAVVEVPATEGGRVEAVLVKAGDEVKTGQVVLRLAGAAQPAPAPVAPQPAPAPVVPQPVAAPVPAAPVVSPASAADQRRLIPAAPSVRRLARELGIDLSQVMGSGPAFRISNTDLHRLTAGSLAPAVVPATATPTPATLPDFARWGQVRREAMSGVRKATVRAMAQAWTTIPMVTQFDKADITDTEALRKKYAPRAEKRGARLTMSAILLKAIAVTLKAFPKFNASIDLAANEVIYKDYIHLGLAVDTPAGLLVPVIRDADRKGIIQLAAEVGEIATRARDRKLSPDEMQGGTFSLSNLGGIGGTGFTPIVNWPEVAIMGVSRSEIQPVWNEAQQAFVPRLMMPFSLSYDHRLIDGADAARFTRYLADLLEDPILLGFEG